VIVSLPKVSIVIPAHNAGKWIRRAIESALAQTVTPEEVIVIDDHSNDDTRSIAESFQERVLVLPARARGSNPARNFGLQQARSAWVQFLDADDYLLPEKIALQLSALTLQSCVDLIFSPSLMVNAPGVGPVVPNTLPDEDPIVAFLENRGFQTGAVLWRREALVSIGGWNEKIERGQDYEVVLRAFQAGLRMQWSPHAGAAYCLHEGQSISRARPFATIQSNVTILRAFVLWLKSTGRLTPAYARRAHQRFFGLLWSAASYNAGWTEETYARLVQEKLIRIRPLASKQEACIALFGWRKSLRLRRLIQDRNTA